MIEAAFSPCPNDTFAIAGWALNHIHTQTALNVQFFDIEQLNTLAIAGTFPFIKMSCACFSHVQNIYDLLPVGAAIGQHVGPKLVTKTQHQRLDTVRIAHPGVHTTAYFLLRTLFPEITHTIALPYDHIIAAILQGKVDGGVLIHESRFTYHEHNLYEQADLGALYVHKYRASIPLGIIGVRRDVSEHVREQFITHFRMSLDYAHTSRDRIMPYVRTHAQELDDTVISQHIDLYVTKDTRELSQKARDDIHLFVRISQHDT